MCTFVVQSKNMYMQMRFFSFCKVSEVFGFGACSVPDYSLAFGYSISKFILKV